MSHTQKKTTRQDVTMLKGYKVLSNSKAKMLPYIVAYMCVCVSRSVVSDSFATPWTVALQAPQPLGFSRLEYWSGLPFPSPGDLSNPGTEPACLAAPARCMDSLSLATGEALHTHQQMAEI